MFGYFNILCSVLTYCLHMVDDIERHDLWSLNLHLFYRLNLPRNQQIIYRLAFSYQLGVKIRRKEALQTLLSNISGAIIL